MNENMIYIFTERIVMPNQLTKKEENIAREIIEKACRPSVIQVLKGKAGYNKMRNRSA
jgi:hypothetical protein